ncbi:organic cation transporter protein isoform X2 [Halyomorpha halys]|uniref:organic cation transporter protein isoform X2 n=1 Tax=Halyomorpha halys TaxID=286706 RepID=UPI000D0C9239|nr:organic cation transporter protein-like isoform X2 [Halyomorpha halys]
MDPAAIENALEKKCKNHCWLVWILFLTASPTIVVGSHLVSYVFLGGNPSFFCNIPELVEANWTKEQIREISSPGLAKQSCVHYAWNYSILKDLDFNDALSYCNTSQKPDLVKCKNYIYDEEVVHQTIVSKWDLVCDDLPLRSTAQSSVAVGKVIGAVLLGMLSDRYGRKKVFIFSSILFWVAGPSAAFVDSYIMFIAFRLMIGIAGSGLYETAYTILLELTVKTYRAYLANIFNLAFSCGLLQLSILAYLTNDWRQLQLAISIPMVLLVIHCWFLPESPRWLITSGKLEKASKIIGSAWRLVPIDPDHTPQLVLKHQPGSSGKSLLFFLKDYLKLFSTFELTKRTLICNYLWFMGNLYYFVITLSGVNFEVNQYIYVALNGIVEIPGYLFPLLILTYFGRKSSAIALCIVAGTAMLIMIVLPQGWPIICVSLVGRLVLASAYGIIMFYTIELYPTENRNTAMGSCITTSQFGPMLAPYIVDILGMTIQTIKLRNVAKRCIID